MEIISEMLLKGACSVIFGQLYFFNLTDVITFLTNISSEMGKKEKKKLNCISFASKNHVFLTYKFVLHNVVTVTYNSNSILLRQDKNLAFYIISV